MAGIQTFRPNYTLALSSPPFEAVAEKPAEILQQKYSDADAKQQELLRFCAKYCPWAAERVLNIPEFLQREFDEMQQQYGTKWAVASFDDCFGALKLTECVKSRALRSWVRSMISNPPDFDSNVFAEAREASDQRLEDMFSEDWDQLDFSNDNLVSIAIEEFGAPNFACLVANGDGFKSRLSTNDRKYLSDSCRSEQADFEKVYKQILVHMMYYIAGDALDNGF